MGTNHESDLTDDRIDAFWHWFTENQGQLQRMLDRDETQELAQLVQSRLDDLSPQIAWEIGPGLVKPYMLVLPTAGGSDLSSVALRIMQKAPRSDAWEFHASRPPRPFPPQIQLPDRDLTLETLGWTFLLEGSQSANRFDLRVFSDELARHDERTALTAVLVLLDAVLGEAVVERWIGDIRVEQASSVGEPMPTIGRKLGERVG